MAEQDRFALDVIRQWPDVAREAAYNVLLAHGAPDHLDDDAVRWDDVGPWKRVVVCADDDDDDPSDVVESVIDATIPDSARDAVGEIASDWHVHVEDDGELAVRGPDLKTNVLTLNVVHCMVHDGLTPEQARERRALQLAELRDGHPPDDVDELHFVADAPHGEPQTITPHAPGDVVAAEHRDEVGNST
jgi:hypothetical protein